MDKRLISLEVENFRSLRKVHLPLGDLTVLVGPNGAGKTNVLKVFDFLADIVHTDLWPAINRRGDIDELLFHGGRERPSTIRIKTTGIWTPTSTTVAPDSYELTLDLSWENGPAAIARQELFSFNQSEGAREISIRGQRAMVASTDGSPFDIGIKGQSSGLSTLPRLEMPFGGVEVSAVAAQLSSIRIFDVDVDKARKPSRPAAALMDDASNLAASLMDFAAEDDSKWESLQDDARRVLPQLDSIDFISGSTGEVTIILHEKGLREPTPLAEASYGTVRLLGLLALLYDSDPSALTCIEEIDHGLHPQALELLVERLREASERSQFIIATHSPALVDRLRLDEIVVCERRDDGSSAIPAISAAEIRRIVDSSEGLPLGELWFSGALGGDL